MSTADDLKIKHENPVEIADGVFWVGFYDIESGLHCNPYLIVDNDEAVIIDGGSRPDFPIVMMKIFQTGISPKSIKTLIYQHYDPDLCGSVSNFEDIISNKDLKILTSKENSMFIRHYSVTSDIHHIEQNDFKYRFSSGRELEFILTPFSHSAGSFVTLDKKNSLLFTSDLFGSYGKDWELYLDIDSDCYTCNDYSDCPNKKPECPFVAILEFHKRVMTSNKALRYAMNMIRELQFDIVAPQHGSIIKDKSVIDLVINNLSNYNEIGIDGISKV
ncbi:MBL fold metallo-hydrolase [candidate division KSB1 bacterium]